MHKVKILEWEDWIEVYINDFESATVAGHSLYTNCLVQLLINLGHKVEVIKMDEEDE
ncbi:MAG: hypothetical protein AABY07_01255 [Nanoarchaeota archaeon]